MEKTLQWLVPIATNTAKWELILFCEQPYSILLCSCFHILGSLPLLFIDNHFFFSFGCQWFKSEPITALVGLESGQAQGELWYPTSFLPFLGLGFFFPIFVSFFGNWIRMQAWKKIWVLMRTVLTKQEGSCADWCDSNCNIPSCRQGENWSIHSWTNTVASAFGKPVPAWNQWCRCEVNYQIPNKLIHP